MPRRKRKIWNCCCCMLECGRGSTSSSSTRTSTGKRNNSVKSDSARLASQMQRNKRHRNKDKRKPRSSSGSLRDLSLSRTIIGASRGKGIDVLKHEKKKTEMKNIKSPHYGPKLTNSQSASNTMSSLAAYDRKLAARLPELLPRKELEDILRPTRANRSKLDTIIRMLANIPSALSNSSKNVTSQPQPTAREKPPRPPEVQPRLDNVMVAQSDEETSRLSSSSSVSTIDSSSDDSHPSKYEVGTESKVHSLLDSLPQASNVYIYNVHPSSKTALPEESDHGRERSSKKDASRQRSKSEPSSSRSSRTVTSSTTLFPSHSSISGLWAGPVIQPVAVTSSVPAPRQSTGSYIRRSYFRKTTNSSH